MNLFIFIGGMIGGYLSGMGTFMFRCAAGESVEPLCL